MIEVTGTELGWPDVAFFLGLFAIAAWVLWLDHRAGRNNRGVL